MTRSTFMTGHLLLHQCKENAVCTENFRESGFNDNAMYRISKGRIIYKRRPSTAWFNTADSIPDKLKWNVVKSAQAGS